MEIFNAIFLYFFIITFSYLLGSIPFGYLLTRYFTKVDIRNIGSGNIGTTNVLRTGKKILALLTLCFDIFKGFLPIYLAFKLVDTDAQSVTFIYLASIFTFLGHIFPIWLKFKGGKGVATFIGIIFGLSYCSALIFIFSWLLIALVSKKSSISSIFASLITTIYFYLFNSFLGPLVLLLQLIIILKHSENIKRILNKTEPNISL
ncbi:MAG: glycerol-3-phosphate 1-O-acyltransferase PlsY [Pseudomonadota bacterium]|nr:glycerol-3-phosphate 1-O-acyltransferase PlsY [Pseudomonadota bacterium]